MILENLIKVHYVFNIRSEKESAKLHSQTRCASPHNCIRWFLVYSIWPFSVARAQILGLHTQIEFINENFFL